MLKDSKIQSSFSVDDIERAWHFYKIKLGLDVTKEAMGILMLHLQNTNIIIYPKPNHTAATYTILNFSVEDINKEVDELTRQGIIFENYDMDPIKTDEKGIARNSPGPLMAWFKDPAGNILGVLQAK